MPNLGNNSQSLPAIGLTPSQRRPSAPGSAGRSFSPSQRRLMWSAPLVGLGLWAVAGITNGSDASAASSPLSVQLAALIANPAQPPAPEASAMAPFASDEALDEPMAPPRSETVEAAVSSAAAPAVAPAPAVLRPRNWAPQRLAAERNPSDHPPVASADAVRVRVVTIRARVTAYTPYDHAETHPQWADGIVAWHPGGKQRRVENHRYGLATDWAQFPPGATFIRVPGYMESTFPQFPENFRVVDDACGQSRRARRNGLQPVIDVRFMTRYSAIDPRGGWGSRNLNVEVIYPDGFVIPTDLRRWVVSDEWHTYHNGTLIERSKR